MNKLGITLGDPAGVGPELIVKLSEKFSPENAYIVYGEEKTLREAEKLLNKELLYKKVSSAEELKEPGIYLVDLNISEVAVPEPSITSGKVAVAYLARATVDAVCGNIDGLLTMPLNKFWAKRAGFSYPGQTEYLAQASNVREFAMMMYSERIKVVLATAHVPIREVPTIITRESIVSKLSLLLSEYERLFGREPRIGVLGLNPHSGEGGDMGREDIEHILPAVEEFRSKGFKVEGPLVPDTAFLRADEYDLFLCMYHDQGLIPFKLLSFREGVNVTLGLPFVRTSPDHGTAYDIAWKGVADPGPSRKALELLEELTENLKE